MRGGKRAPGGGRLLPGCWASGVRPSPTPNSPSFGRVAGVRYPLTVVAGGCAWGRVTYPSARALASWLCALLGRHEGAQGGPLLPPHGASGFGRSAPPDRPSLGRTAGVRYPLAVGAGGVGSGTRHLPHSARSCEVALRSVGTARGRPGGAPLAWLWGVLGWVLSHARPPALGACRWGPLPTGCWCGVRAWGPGLSWHLPRCRGSSCVMRASGVCGTRWPSLLGTCPCPWAVASGVPLWCASWPRVGAPRLVRSGCSPCSGQLSRRRGACPHPGACRPHDLLGCCAGGVEAIRESGSLCLPLALAEAGALGALRVVPVWFLAMGLSLAGLSVFGLWLSALRWFGVCGPGH